MLAATPDNHMVIQLDQASVFYRLHRNRPKSLKEYALRRIRARLEVDYVKALDGISLEIQTGEVFGIVGRNGAGKSTLLKVISGIVRPTSGRVRVWPKPASLLAIGAGFHEELTGRENVYLYSAILGRSRSLTDSLLDGIVDFAELSDFIDSPLRVYSSGMVARLGFATAMAERPELLLVDEVLGVGDEQFQQKCQAKFLEFREGGTTTVIVSHSLRIVELMCSRVAWLMNGRLESLGAASSIVADYKAFQERGTHYSGIRSDA